MINILPATEDELNWAAKLLSESDPWITLKIDYEKCNKLCHDKSYEIYIAHINDEPCGVIVLDRKGLAGSPYLKSIAVDPKYRNQGVGRALIEFAENLYRKQYKHFFLCVSSFNKKAQSLYDRLGYIKVGEFKDYIIEGESEILMYKKL